MLTAHDILFGAALVAYFLGSVIFPANLFLKNPRLNSVGTAIAFFGMVCHTASIIFRGVHNRTLPFGTLAEGWSILAWALVAFYLAIAVRPRLRSLGAFALPAALLGVLVAAVTAPKSSQILPSVSTWGLALHVPSSVLSIGAFAVAFACAVCYLIQDRLLKEKRLGGLMRSLPPLDVLDTTSYWLVVIGFCLLTVGMVTGAILTGNIRSLAWLQHPDTCATILLWLTYAAYLYVRGVARWRGRRTHTAVVVAVAALLALYGGAVFFIHPVSVHGTTIVKDEVQTKSVGEWDNRSLKKPEITVRHRDTSTVTVNGVVK